MENEYLENEIGYKCPNCGYDGMTLEEGQEEAFFVDTERSFQYSVHGFYKDADGTLHVDFHPEEVSSSSDYNYMIRCGKCDELINPKKVRYTYDW